MHINNYLNRTGTQGHEIGEEIRRVTIESRWGKQTNNQVTKKGGVNTRDSGAINGKKKQTKQSQVLTQNMT